MQPDTVPNPPAENAPAENAPVANAPGGAMPGVQVIAPNLPKLTKEQARSELITIGLITVGVLFVAAGLLAIVNRWRNRNDSEHCSPIMSLSSYREMYENGELTHNEYQKILAKLGKEIKDVTQLTEADAVGSDDENPPAENKPS